MALVALGIALGGCRSVPQDAGSGERDQALGKKAQPIAASPVSSPGTEATPGRVGPGASASQSGGPAGRSPQRAVRRIGSADDKTADIGISGKKYADLKAVVLEDLGESLRVTVVMSGAIPPNLPGDEVMGVGVDLFGTSSSTESDFQLFADGSSEGWFAYLETPRGLVEYEGTLGVGGDRLVFTLGWSHLDQLEQGTFSVFADRAGPGAVPALGEESQDRCPDSGRAAFSR